MTAPRQLCEETRAPGHTRHDRPYREAHAPARRPRAGPAGSRDRHARVRVRGRPVRERPSSRDRSRGRPGRACPRGVLRAGHVRRPGGSEREGRDHPLRPLERDPPSARHHRHPSGRHPAREGHARHRGPRERARRPPPRRPPSHRPTRLHRPRALAPHTTTPRTTRRVWSDRTADRPTTTPPSAVAVRPGGATRTATAAARAAATRRSRGFESPRPLAGLGRAGAAARGRDRRRCGAPRPDPPRPAAGRVARAGTVSP